MFNSIKNNDLKKVEDIIDKGYDIDHENTFLF
jgi:hypothetical protein